MSVSLRKFPQRRRFALSRVDIAVLVACFSVLAMVAVPRHLKLSADIRRSDVQALAASVVYASEIANALWQAQLRPQTLSLPAGDVVIINGYPSAATVAGALKPMAARGFEFRAGRWSHPEAPGCGVEYQPPASPGGLPSIIPFDKGC